MGILAVVRTAAVGTGVKVPLGCADTESSGCVSTLPEFGASHRILENTPMLKHITMQYCRSCVLAPLITIEKSGSNEKPSSQKEMQVFKSYNLDLRQFGSQDWDTA